MTTRGCERRSGNGASRRQETSRRRISDFGLGLAQIGRRSVPKMETPHVVDLAIQN